MDAVDIVELMAQLEEEHCELNHGPDSQDEKRTAVDYIVQPFGYTVNEIEDVVVREMIIPVCAECAEAVQGNEWVLFYCFECCSSHWVYKQFSKLIYRHNILWLRGCPECSETLDGLYFTDIQAITGNPTFVSRMSIPEAA